MNTLRAKLYLVCSLLCLGVVLPIFGPVQEAAAAGETYQVSNGNTIRASGGEFGSGANFTHRGNGTYGYDWAAQSESPCVLEWRITGITGSGATGYTGTIATGGSCPFGKLTGQVTIAKHSNGTNLAGVAAGNGNGPPQEASEEEDACTEASGVLGWAICPTINALADATAKLDCWVLYLLTIDTNAIFNNNSARSGCDPTATSGTRTAESSQAFRTAWSVFRNIAYAILLILGLIMVVSQIAGLDLFDAYTIRKMLPKLIVAVIFIALSWNAMAFIFTASNDAAYAIMDLIKTPFAGINAGIGTDNGDATISAILAVALVAGVAAGGAYLFIMGPMGVLALVGTVLLAVFSGFILLAARNVVAYLLIIAAPVAIICYAFEPFKKLFTLWRTLLFTILVSVPVIAAVIQLSHVGALIAYIADSTLATVTSLAILIGGYALIWGIFKKLDTVTGNLGNVVSGATGRLSKGLSDYRSNQAKQRYGEAKAGFRDWGKFGSAIRQASVMGRPGQGNLLTKGGRAKLKRSEAAIMSRAAEELAKNDDNATFGNDDATAVVTRGVKDRADYESKYVERLREQHARRAAKAAAEGRTIAAFDEQAARAEARSTGLEMEATSGAKLGSRALQRAAATARWTSPSAYNDHDLDTPEGQKAMRQEMAEEIGSMMDSGLMTSVEVAATMKKNTARADISGHSFPKMMVQANEIYERYKARQKGGTVTARRVTAAGTNEVDASGATVTETLVAPSYNNETLQGGLLSDSEVAAWDRGSVRNTTVGQRISQRTEAVKVQAGTMLRDMRQAFADTQAAVQSAQVDVQAQQTVLTQAQTEMQQVQDEVERVMTDPRSGPTTRAAVQQRRQAAQDKLRVAQQGVVEAQGRADKAQEAMIRQAAWGSAEHTIMSSYASPENVDAFDKGYLNQTLYEEVGPDGQKKAITVFDYIERLRANSDVFRRFERSYTQSGTAQIQATLAQQQAAGAQAGPGAAGPPPVLPK